MRKTLPVQSVKSVSCGAIIWTSTPGDIQSLSPPCWSGESPASWTLPVMACPYSPVRRRLRRTAYIYVILCSIIILHIFPASHSCYEISHPQITTVGSDWLQHKRRNSRINSWPVILIVNISTVLVWITHLVSRWFLSLSLNSSVHCSDWVLVVFMLKISTRELEWKLGVFILKWKIYFYITIVYISLREGLALLYSIHSNVSEVVFSVSSGRQVNNDKVWLYIINIINKYNK